MWKNYFSLSLYADVDILLLSEQQHKFFVKLYRIVGKDFTIRCQQKANLFSQMWTL